LCAALMTLCASRKVEIWRGKPRLATELTESWFGVGNACTTADKPKVHKKKRVTKRVLKNIVKV